MTDHPSALVSVPVETQECARLLVQELTPDQGQTAGRAFGLAVSLQSMLSAAPAAPQAVGVGEDDGAWIIVFEDRDREQEVFTGFGARDAAQRRYDQVTASWNAHLFERVRSALPLRAPSREPEGGAVDDGAFKIATDLHNAYEQLIYGLPKYLDAENLTDEENMIREAWITLEVTAHRLAALATREEAPGEKTDCERCAGNGEIVTDWDEYISPPKGAPADHATADCPDCDGIGKVEAPAEAGEDDGAWIIYFEDRDRELEAFSGFGAREAAQRRYEQVTVSWNAHLFERVKSALPALRAQPQAREVTTPSPLGGASVGPDEAEEASSVDATPQVAQQNNLGTQPHSGEDQ